MRYAMVDRNGQVVNIVEGNPDDPPHFENYTMVSSDTANIGDNFDGKSKKFSSKFPTSLRFRLR